MTESLNRQSAKIYQFPDRRRASTGVVDDLKAGDVVPARAPNVVAGSGWYHDAAIAEADQTRTRWHP
jgi:hypothetical protein